MSAKLTVGMRGAYQPIEIVATAPTGLSFLVHAPAITVELHGPRSTAPIRLTDSDFSWSDVTASSARATYVPDGTEIDRAGTWTVAISVTADGQHVDFISMKVEAEANVRVD